MIDKTSANYCTYFRPARGAYREGPDAGRARVRDELADLFGIVPETQQSASENASTSVAKARLELDALFKIKSDSVTDSTAADSEDRER